MSWLISHIQEASCIYYFLISFPFKTGLWFLRLLKAHTIMYICIFLLNCWLWTKTLLGLKGLIRGRRFSWENASISKTIMELNGFKNPFQEFTFSEWGGNPAACVTLLFCHSWRPLSAHGLCRFCGLHYWFCPKNFPCICIPFSHVSVI